MTIRIILILLLAIPGIVMADAGSGMFMGYQLGNSYQLGANTRQHQTANGNLILTAENPVKPDDINEVSLVTTSRSLTIGHINAASWFNTEEEARAFGRKYVDLLRAKYPDWAFGREGMDTNLRIVEVNFDLPPYNLRLRVNEDRRKGDSMWRLSMTLGWLPDSKEAMAWRNTSRREHVTAEEDGRNKLLEEADLRGL